MTDKTKPTSKVIQISTSTLINDRNDTINITTALCEDGSIWERNDYGNLCDDWTCMLKAGYDKPTKEGGMTSRGIVLMLEEIRSDLDDRSGFHLDIDLYEECMKDTWIKIVNKHLDKPTKEKHDK